MTRVEGAGPRLVLLHGLGADERDLLPLAQAFAPGLDVWSVRAPLPYDVGYSWFDIAWDSPTFIADVRQVDLAAKGVLASLPEGPFSLIGFSQGGVVGQAVISQAAERIEAAALLSTWPLFGWSAPADLPPVLIQHGTEDSVVPYLAAGLLARQIEGATLRSYPMGHGVSEESLRDLAEWLETHRRKGGT